MGNGTFDLTPFVLPMVHVGPPETAQGGQDSSRVGSALFELWNQFRAQLNGMADPGLIAATRRAAVQHHTGKINEAEYLSAHTQALHRAKPVTDPGVDRRALMAALGSVKDNIKSTSLDPTTKMELVGYAQALLEGLGRARDERVEMGAMARWLLVGLGFKGEGLN